MNFFTPVDAIKMLSNSDPVAVRRLLSDMTKRGLIMRIKDGLYSIIPYEKDPENYLPNWHLVADALMSQQKYYIGFYSALDIHGLITQPSLTEQIVTEKQIIPKTRIVKNVKFEFITMGSSFFGYEKTWIDDFHKIHCSDLEKTILDCLYLPGKANGINEIVKAMVRVIDKLNKEKLLLYLEKFNAPSIYKRLGFILQHLDKHKDLTERLSIESKSSYVVLDPSLPKRGKHNSRWRIIDNLGIEQVLESLLT